MNQKKLDDYNLTGSIHTLAIKSPGIVEDIQEEVSNCIIASSQTKNGTTTTSIINVNKLMGDVFRYSEFETVFNTILAGAGIDEYNIVRADMRFDSYDKEHYRQYAKLNRYLISLLAVTYKVKNAYRTTNLFSQKQLSVAIKNKYFEIEKYDKEIIFKFLHRRPPAVFGKIKIQAPIAGKIKKYPPIPSDERIRHRKQEKSEIFFLFFYFFLKKLL